MSEAKLTRVAIDTTMGRIVVEVDGAKAPKTVENFLKYVNENFYAGLLFHRVIPNFMVQGGGMGADMLPKPGHPPIQNEADNGLRNAIGTIAMARTNDPHSATSQFFINVRDNAFLNHTGKAGNGWGYCVFGKVVEGMDVVKEIEQSPTGRHGFHCDVPVAPIIIERTVIVAA